jgi:hypothetical protein
MPDHPVGPIAVDMWMRRAPLAGDRVDALDVLAAEVVEHLADQPNALVFAYARAQEGIQLVVSGVDHRTCLSQQRNLVDGLDAACLQEDLLAVDNGQSLFLQRGQDRHFDHVHSDWLGCQPVLVHDGCDLAGHLLGDTGIRMERPAQRGDASAGSRSARSRGLGNSAVAGLAVVVEPRVV